MCTTRTYIIYLIIHIPPNPLCPKGCSDYTDTTQWVFCCIGAYLAAYSMYITVYYVLPFDMVLVGFIPHLDVWIW